MRGCHHASKLISCCCLVSFFAIWSISSNCFFIPLLFDGGTGSYHESLISWHASSNDLIRVNFDNKEFDAWNLFLKPFTFVKGITHCERKDDVFTCGDSKFVLCHEEFIVRFPVFFFVFCLRHESLHCSV